MKRKPKERGEGPAVSSAKVKYERHKTLFVNLYMEGRTIEDVRRVGQQQIGRFYSIPMITRFINEARKEWEQNRLRLMEDHKTFELEQINRLQVQYSEGYQRSMKTAKHTTKVKTPGKEQEGSKMAVAQVKEESKPSPGDPRFLNGIQWCIDKRCEIMGINAPQLPPVPPQPGDPTFQQINNIDNRTVIIRRNVFQTRQTTMPDQILPALEEEL